MALKQTIAIIGATESLGSAVAKSLSKSNNRLILMGRDEESLEALKSGLIESSPNAEIEISSCAKEASWEADIVIITTPLNIEKEIVEKIKEVSIGKVVISVSSLSIRNYKSFMLSPETSAAEELQKALPLSKVVKTFNSVFAGEFTSSKIYNNTGETFIAGNNSEALETVSKLILSAGLTPIVVGDLSVSRRLESLQFHN